MRLECLGETVHQVVLEAMIERYFGHFQLQLSELCTKQDDRFRCQIAHIYWHSDAPICRCLLFVLLCRKYN